MTKRNKRLAHRVLVSLQIECEVSAKNTMHIIRNLKAEQVLSSDSDIRDMKFLLIKKQTEPFTVEEIEEAYCRRRQQPIVESDDDN